MCYFKVTTSVLFMSENYQLDRDGLLAEARGGLTE
jgi:hypothetical protein